MAIDYYLDLYPADDPRDGALLGRFDATLLEDVDYRDVVGVGSWQAVLKASMAEAALIDPDGEQYFRLVRDDGATEAVVGGGFDSRMAYDAAVAAETKRLTIGGPTTMAYLARAVMAPHSYLSEFIPGSYGGDPFDRMWRLYLQGPLAGGAYLGAMLWRVMQEATHYRSGATYKHTHGDQTVATDSHADDRTENVLPALTLGFTQYLDSNGSPWTLTSGDFTAQIGENVLGVVHRLMQAGLYVSMDPDTFELNAWEDEDHRRDRTGAAFGANVVRLQAPTDGTTATGSYLSDVKRIRSSHIRRTTLWVGGGDDTYVKATGASRIPWEGFLSSDTNNAAALAQIGSTQVTAREEASDVGSVRIKLGSDPATGYYLPFEDVRVDDLITVHTGTDDWDFTEATYPVAAVRIQLREAGDWDAFVELGGSLETAERRQFEVATAAAHTHPLPFCVPGTPAAAGVMEDADGWPANIEVNVVDLVVGSETDKVIIAWLYARTSPGIGAVDVRWYPGFISEGTKGVGDQAFTEIAAIGSGPYLRVYQLINPTASTQPTSAVRFSVGNCSRQIAGVHFASGIDQTTPVRGTPATATGTGTSASAPVAAEAGDTICSFLGVPATATFLPASGQVEDFDVTIGGTSQASGAGGHGEIDTQAWTISSSLAWMAGSVALVPSAAGAAGDGPLELVGSVPKIARCDHNHYHGELLGLGDDDHPQYLQDADLAALLVDYLLTADLETAGHWEPVTNGNVASPEIVFDNGDVVMEWVP